LSIGQYLGEYDPTIEDNYYQPMILLPNNHDAVAATAVVDATHGTPGLQPRLALISMLDTAGPGMALCFLCSITLCLHLIWHQSMV
jgi:hypothetical protein